MPLPANLVVVGNMHHNYVMGGERVDNENSEMCIFTNSNCIGKKRAHNMLSLHFVNFHLCQLLSPLDKLFFLHSLQ